MNKNILSRIMELEATPITTTNGNNEYSKDEEIPFNYIEKYLYHGIRSRKYLDILEKILKDKKILAGKYIKDYYLYSDNCNKGEYVSLLKYQNNYSLDYKIFIESNISLLVTPLCNAIETKYIDYYTWEQIQKSNLELKHIYSYMYGECMCKDYISIDMVCAIGVPYQKLIHEERKEYADKLIEDIKLLMQKYDINFPIVDTSRYNHIIVDPNNNKIKKKQQRR